MFGKISLYGALATAVMTTLLLLSYALFQYVPDGIWNRALLLRTPELTTDVWAVFDPLTGEVRYGNSIAEAHPIASITKLFTAYAVLDSEAEGETGTVGWGDLNTNGEAGKLTYGETLTLHALLFPLLIESSNDAGAVIARVLGKRYGEHIEALIATLSLSATTMGDTTGLSSTNVSSPQDLARFYTHLRKTYPHITDITRLRMYITKERGLINNNPLRELEGYRGGKYGYTPEAGRTFVGTILLPSGKEVGIVLLGSTDIMADAAALRTSLW